MSIGGQLIESARELEHLERVSRLVTGHDAAGARGKLLTAIAHRLRLVLGNAEPIGDGIDGPVPQP